MFHLLRRRSFAALTLTQFLGAFNDNAFKQLVLLLTTSLLSAAPVEWVAESALAQRFGQALPATLFALPFVLLGVTTGSLADRCSKSRIIKLSKVLEIVVMSLAVLAFQARSFDALMLVVFLMGAQSALFGPSKYGSIKEIVGNSELSRGNAMIQMTTMLAILLGTMLGGTLREDFAEALWVPGLAYVALACVGTAVSLGVERLPPVDPSRRLEWNVPRVAFRRWRALGGDRPLVLSIVASAFFYLVGATLLLVVNAYGEYLGLGGKQTSFLNAMTVLGIGLGSVAAGHVSRDGIESGLIPLGLLGLSGSLFAVGLAPDSVGLLRASLFGAGFFGGVFSIPIRALIQGRPADDRRGAVLGLSQVLDFVGILTAGAVFYLLSRGLGLTPPWMFVAVASGVLVFTLASLLYTAEFAVRLVVLAIVRLTYRLNVVGRAHLTQPGGAILVANHVSFVDAVLIGAAAPRPVSFLMYRPLFQLPLVGWFARRMKAIPVSANDTREQKDAALAHAARIAREGGLVCIFAEGAITRTGAMTTFASGVERIAAQARVPLVPIALDRLWGSLFSFSGKRFFWKLPRRIPYPVDLVAGAPLPHDTSAADLRERIQELIAEQRATRSGRRGSLAWRFLFNASRSAWRPALVDSTGARMTHGQLLRRVLRLRAVLARRLGSAPNVGVVLPPGADGAAVNIALALAGRATVNLNTTLEDEMLARMLARAEVETLLTSRAWLAALKRESVLGPGRTLFIEDLEAEVTPADRRAAWLATLLPAAWLANRYSPQRSADEVATILFSSGSTGEPKGVQLTHANVLSNVQSVLQVVAIGPGDAVLGVLPLFHAFGYTVTFWTPLLAGAQGVYHANPLDARGVGELCGAHGVTVTVATPTFYQAWLRRCEPAQLARVRLALSGAQRLPDALADAWEERFGGDLMEGYGCTELSPVVSLNLPDPPGGERQRAHRRGTVGRALPGVAVRTVHAETRAPLPSGEEGRIQVKGGNVMLGYLKDPERTREVLVDGWYDTGDVGRVDRHGFLVITGRVTRFSKIGGEMVPHGRVEDALLEVLAEACDGAALPELCVTAVDAGARGEELVVLHTPLPLTPDELLERLRATELPRLFHPRASRFVELDALPTLGTGKLDLEGARRVARERSRVGR